MVHESVGITLVRWPSDPSCFQMRERETPARSKRKADQMKNVKVFGRERERRRTERKVKMRRGCKKCSKWEKHFYWSHMDLTKICFCKKMDASSFMNKMDLPNDFHRNFKGRIGETVELKGPSGNVWQARVIKSTQKFTFQTGWKNFVIANNIEANDLLVFKYSGNSLFQVQIFDPTGCERTSSFFAQREEIQAQESSDSSVKIMEGPVHNMYQDKVTISGSSSDSEYSTDDSTPVRMPRGRASKEAGTSKDPNGGCIFKAPNIERITFAHESSLTPGDKERALQLSKRTQPGNSCFAILIKPSMIMGRQFRFAIPVKFSREHLPQQTIKGILCYKKRTWPLSITYGQIYASVSAGWKKFVQDNHVQAGDLCLFELMKSNKTVSFKVHISRK